MRTRTTLSLLLTALVASACSTGPTTAPSTGAPAPGGGLTVSEALATDADGPLLVRGFLIDDAGDVQLCEAAMESYPPQCGGASVPVDGVAVARLDGAKREGRVTWVDDARITGELRAGVLVASDTAIG